MGKTLLGHLGTVIHDYAHSEHQRIVRELEGLLLHAAVLFNRGVLSGMVLIPYI